MAAAPSGFMFILQTVRKGVKVKTKVFDMNPFLSGIEPDKNPIQ